MHKVLLSNKITSTIFSAIILAISSFGQTPRPIPSDFAAGSAVSYVKTTVASAPEQVPNTLVTRPLRDVKQTTQYLDGLRPAGGSCCKAGLSYNRRFAGRYSQRFNFRCIWQGALQIFANSLHYK